MHRLGSVELPHARRLAPGPPAGAGGLGELVGYSFALADGRLLEGCTCGKCVVGQDHLNIWKFNRTNLWNSLYSSILLVFPGVYGTHGSVLPLGISPVGLEERP